MNINDENMAVANLSNLVWFGAREGNEEALVLWARTDLIQPIAPSLKELGIRELDESYVGTDKPPYFKIRHTNPFDGDLLPAAIGGNPNIVVLNHTAALKLAELGVTGHVLDLIRTERGIKLGSSISPGKF